MTDSLFKADRSSKPVTCLGLTFKDDDARLAHYRKELLKCLSSPDFKTQPGFPAAEDDTILNLSDPPYFTLCPNPFLSDVLSHFGRADAVDDSYARDPFATDVSEGRGDTLYNAHGYHTKVPHKALMRYFLHYTTPGDIVFDGFCGTGMTGVAALMCSDRSVVESLGYRVEPDGTIRDSGGNPISKLGYRTAVLAELSPIACFIAYNYTTPQQPEVFASHGRALLANVDNEHGWMCCTLHAAKPHDVAKAIAALSSSHYKDAVRSVSRGRIHYAVWSDVFACQQCGSSLTYWTEAVDVDNGKIRDSFPCPNCKSSLSKRSLQRLWDSYFDPWLGRVAKVAKTVPVLINYTYDGKTYQKAPDKFDLALLDKVRGLKNVPAFPTSEIAKGDKTGDPFAVGIRHVHQYFTSRNLWLISALWNDSQFPAIKWAITGIMQRASRQHQIAITRVGGEKAGEGGATAGHRRGTLYGTVRSNRIQPVGPAFRESEDDDAGVSTDCRDGAAGVCLCKFCSQRWGA